MDCKLCKWLDKNINCYRCSKQEILIPCEYFELDKDIRKEIHKINIHMYNINKIKINKKLNGGISKND